MSMTASTLNTHFEGRAPRGAALPRFDTRAICANTQSVVLAVDDHPDSLALVADINARTLTENPTLAARMADANELDRLLARMRSMKFSQQFIEQNKLLPYIFHNHWDPQQEAWKEGFKPDLREAGLTFMTRLRGVELDEASGLLRINFTTRDPQFSAALANAFVSQFNQFIRDAEARELEARRDYLTKRLKEVDNIELHKSIYRLMETQLAAESLLYARSEYPLELIQPAFPALYKTYPLRKKWAVMAMLATIMLGIMFAIGMVLLSKIKQAIAAYQTKQLTELQASSSVATANKPAITDKAPVDDHYNGDDWIDDD